MPPQFYGLGPCLTLLLLSRLAWFKQAKLALMPSDLFCFTNLASLHVSEFSRYFLECHSSYCGLPKPHKVSSLSVVFSWSIELTVWSFCSITLFLPPEDAPSPQVQAAVPSVIPTPLHQMRYSSESQETRPLVLLSFPSSPLFWATPAKCYSPTCLEWTLTLPYPAHSTLLLLCL